MSTRDEIIAWAGELEGRRLNAANGAVLTVVGARWTTRAPLWLALDLAVLLDADVGPDAHWLLTDLDVGWASLLDQLGLPAALRIVGHDRRIIDPTRARAVLRLAVA